MGTVYKFTRAGLYDLDGVQTWLDEMAAQGLFLVRWGRLRCLFRQDAPAPGTRYRLDPERERQTSAQLAEMKEVYAASGWEYVCEAQSDFYIFAAKDPSAPELYTDGGSMACALQGLMRQAVITLSWEIIEVLLLLYTARKTVNHLGSVPPAFGLASPGPAVFLLAVLVLLSLLLNFYSMFLLFRASLALKREEALPKSSPRRRSLSLLEGWSRLAALLLGVAVLAVIWHYQSMEYTGDPAELSIPLPSLTQLEDQPGLDLVPFDSGYGYGFHPEEGTYLHSAPSLWVPVHYEINFTGTSGLWRKDVDPDYPLNERYLPRLHLSLYRTRGEFWARIFYDELADQEPLEVDWADEASRSPGGGELVLRRGNRVISVRYTGIRDVEELLPALEKTMGADWT